jgi:hypothetical protein
MHYSCKQQQQLLLLLLLREKKGKPMTKRPAQVRKCDATAAPSSRLKETRAGSDKQASDFQDNTAVPVQY